MAIGPAYMAASSRWTDVLRPADQQGRQQQQRAGVIGGREGRQHQATAAAGNRSTATGTWPVSDHRPAIKRAML